jgi:transcriptional regulator with XRE-family HTH domain
LGYLSIEYINTFMTHRNQSDSEKLQILLKNLRREIGLRQADLAKRLNRPQSYISKYESGEKTLSFLEVREVCEALGFSLQEFIDRFDRKK